MAEETKVTEQQDFNSQPHKEADDARGLTWDEYFQISTHSLTRRLTVLKRLFVL